MPPRLLVTASTPLRPLLTAHLLTSSPPASPAACLRASRPSPPHLPAPPHLTLCPPPASHPSLYLPVPPHLALCPPPASPCLPNAEVLNKSVALHMNINAAEGLQDELNTIKLLNFNLLLII
ncbi:hypothetical protein GUJ93_ZPchr0012g20068 [Zizania palustris]|uniref:Uncharacterized protein n=1 Tax=Zizania palustris TaxID=103762 RepID=A0A8J5WXU9_ZIZPA|nr:hypothetical protein GUJ93_ZPchr0012g20068 [Zizania palustris]